MILASLRRAANNSTRGCIARHKAIMGKLTTHVLDTHAGIPAAHIRIELYAIESDRATLIDTRTTGSDGRCSNPLLEGAGFGLGRYELVYRVAEYFRSRNVVLPDPAFIEDARVRIGIAAPEQHYHVPLLITPWSYSVYRGG